MRQVLIVFYHFAPINVSGLQRILHFLKHLPRNGWQPHVLGVDPETAESFLPRDPALMDRVPPEVKICLAPRRGLFDSLVRRLPSGTEIPDMQAGWYGPAVRMGKRALASEKFDAVLASGSPWTSLLVGRRLARWAGLPYVADFRDPWVGNPYIEAGLARRVLDAALEGAVVRAADRVVANTEQLRLDFRFRYPRLDPERFACVPNGFDSTDAHPVLARRDDAERLVIRHVGSLYAKRDPRPFLRALAGVVAAGEVPRDRVLVEFVGENHRPEGASPDALEAMGIEKIVRFRPPIAHAEALAALASSDAVLIVQPDTGLQVPAKLYEAIGLGREVLCLAPAEGATASIAREEGLGPVADPADEGAIRAAILELWRKKERGVRSGTRKGAGAKYDAKARMKVLAEVLSQAAAAHRARTPVRPGPPEKPASVVAPEACSLEPEA